MSSIEERTAAFYDWEVRGRGWRTYPHTVRIEPAFVPFSGHESVSPSRVDDARRPTFLSSMWDRLVNSHATVGSAVPPHALDLDQTVRDEPRDIAELEVLIPSDEKIPAGVSEGWLRTIVASADRLSYELIAFDRTVSLRVAAHPDDLTTITTQLKSFLPIAQTRAPAQTLASLWLDAVGDTMFGGAEFVLAREFMLPFNVPHGGPDPLTPIIGALSEVRDSSVAVVQVLLEQAQSDWGTDAIRAVTASDGKPFFLDAPEVTQLAHEKCSTPLYAAVVRVAARCPDEQRVVQLLSHICAALSQFGSPDRNDLVPVAPDNSEVLVDDILARTSRRTGMILSLAEISALVRLPGNDVRNPALIRTSSPQSSLPAEVRSESGVTLGHGIHLGKQVAVRISENAFGKHLHLLGSSGSGKSNLLAQIILQIVEAGGGVALLDPHGDLVDDVLARIPESRSKDVVLFDPADPDYVLGWNMLAARSEMEKQILISDFVAVMKRQSTSFGDQMSAVLGNAVLAFVESTRGGTLLDLRRFLLDESFRNEFLTSVPDQYVVSYWREEYSLIAGKRPQAPILTRLDTFLRSRLVREVVAEREKPLDFREVIDSGRIFLAKLSQGAIGQENAALLGSLLVSAFHQAGLSRQDVAAEARRPYAVVIDEAHELATPSMAALFSGIRKYRLTIAVSHQDLFQLHSAAPEVERAVLANAYTRVAFRLSDEDARKLDKSFAGFTADDLVNLGVGEAICRVGKKDDAFRVESVRLPVLSDEDARSRRAKLRVESMTRYGRLRGSASTTAAPRVPADLIPLREAASPVSEPRPSTVHIETTVRTTRPVVETLPGRGGPRHKYLQSLIKRMAVDRGFRATIERTVLDGHGHVDIALDGAGVSVGCEISVTTDAQHELNNLSKCLTAGFDYVVLVSSEKTVLATVEKQLVADAQENGGDVSRLRFLTPEAVAVFLDELVAKSKETTKSVRGYRVNVQYRATSSEDRSSREGMIADVVAKSLRRMGKVSQELSPER